MKKNFLRKVLSLTLAAAFVVTSVPAAALVTNAEDTVEELTPVYEWNFDGNITESISGIEATAKKRLPNAENGDKVVGVEDYDGDIQYGDGREGEGQSLYLDGTYGLDLNVPLEKRTNNSYTISFWANPQADLGWADSLINWGLQATSSDQWVSLAGNGIWSSINGNNNNMVAYTRVNNAWQHYTISVEGSTASVYRNGVLDCTQTVSEVAYTIEGSIVCLGINPWDNSPNCLYDDLKIYNRALTAEEVKTLHGFSFETDSEEIRIGETLNLIVNSAGSVGSQEGDVIEWTSSDETVASVDQTGTVTGLEKGSAKIVASLIRDGVEVGRDECTINVFGEKGKLIANFSFDDETNGFAGAGAVAEKNGTINLIEREDTDGKALEFNGSDTWLNVTAENGESLLTGLEEFTVSFDSYSKKTAASWSFFAAPDANAQGYLSENYIAAFDKQYELEFELYGSGRNNGKSRSIRGTYDEGWKHVDLVVDNGLMRVYFNNEKVAEASGNLHTVSEILGKNSVLQIGLGNWSTGEYFQGYIDNYKIYNYAKTDSEIKYGDPILVNGITINNAPESMTVGDTTTLTAAVAPEDAWDTTVTWESSAPGVVSVDSNTGTITAVSVGTAKITATAADGSGVSASVDITVKEKTYTVTVIGGSIVGTKTEFKYGEAVKIKADAPAAGMKFNRWTVNGETFCFDSIYTFYVKEDITVTAEYIEEATAEEPDVESLVVLNNTSYYDSSTGKVVITIKRILPVGCTITQYGVLATKDDTIGKNADAFTEKATSGVSKAYKSNGSINGSVTIRTGLSSGQTCYTRGYVIYKDSEGNTHYAYSEICSVTTEQ